MPHTKSGSKPGTESTDAIALLTADHEAVKGMFKRFEDMKDDPSAESEKRELVQRICAELTVHTTIEEEIFYPALRDAIDADDLVDEAEVEHASAKDLIEQLEGASPGDEQYDAKVKVLSELVEHHIEEEESEMFPKAKKAIDVDLVGMELAARKHELAAPDEDATAPATRAPKTPSSRSGRRA
jgi:hemerythrin-like domain-containing protein